MATVTKRPTIAVSIVEEKNQWGNLVERNWENLTNLFNDNNNNAHTLQNYPIASGVGTVNKPGKVKATGFGFTGEFGSNTRINKVIFYWDEYARAMPWPGVTHVLMNFPYKDIKLLKANGGGDTGYKRHNIRVHNYRTSRSLEFTRETDMPSVRPSDIQSSDFGVYFNPARNIGPNTGWMFLNDFRVEVDYTDPTYMLQGSISSGKVLGEQAVYTLTLTNTNNCHNGVNIPVSITLPAGLTYSSQSGDGNYNTSTNKWDAVLNNQGTATLKLTLNTTQQGTKSIIASVDNFNISLTRSTVILPPTYTLSSPNNLEVVHNAANLTYPVTVTVNTSIITSAQVKITVPTGLAYVSASGAGTATYNGATREVTWTAQFTNKTATMSFNWLGNAGEGQSDTYKQDITIGNASLTKEIIVLRTDITTPYYSDYIIPNEVIKYLRDGEVYTLSCWSIVTDKILPNVYPGDKNFAISILHDGKEYLSDKATELDNPTRISTTFPYTKNKGLTLRVYGQWLEINPWNATHEVGGFALYYEKQLLANPNLLQASGSDVQLNIATGGDYLKNVNGVRVSSGVTRELSNEWNSNGDYSFKATFNGLSSTEEMSLLANINEAIPVNPRDEIQIRIKHKSTQPFRLRVNIRTNDWNSITTSQVVISAAPNGSEGVLDFTVPESGAYFYVSIMNTTTPVANTVYVDNVKILPHNPLLNIEGKKDYEPPATLFDNPDNLIIDGDYAYTVVDPSQTGAGVLLSDIGFGGLEKDEEMIIKGFQIEGDSDVGDDIGMNLTLYTDNTQSNRSIIVGKDDTGFTIGGKRDKWGLNKITLDNLQFELALSNIGIDSTPAGLRDIRAVLSYDHDQTKGNPGIYLDDIHSREYDIFLVPGWKLPEGTQNDIVKSKLTRSPGEKVTSSTPISKSFTIPFIIMADNLEDATEKLQNISEWMRNKIDKNGEPITKKLRFEWDPNHRDYNVILDDTLEPDFSNPANFKVNAKFYVPDGTGWTGTKQTGAIGRNDGIIPIKPTLTVLCDGSPDGVDIREAYTGQYMKIRPTTPFPQNTILTVDFRNRTILDPNGTDYMGAVTFDSYIIRILEQSEYDFTPTTGGVVTRVEYKEAV